MLDQTVDLAPKPALSCSSLDSCQTVIWFTPLLWLCCSHRWYRLSHSPTGWQLHHQDFPLSRLRIHSHFGKYSHPFSFCTPYCIQVYFQIERVAMFQSQSVTLLADDSPLCRIPFWVSLYKLLTCGSGSFSRSCTAYRWAATFTALHRCFFGFWVGHSRTVSDLSWHSGVALAVCFGSLLCWKVNHCPSPILHTLTAGSLSLAHIYLTT